MRKALVFLTFIFLHPGTAIGQVVPSELKFADLKLKINEAARKEIQEEVDAMVQSSSYFNEKIKRAKLYFPIIERILAEENVPDDIKYLVMQESALIPDAVSTSNAVGFWQFKDFTAVEMGLRIDNHVDERMNIVSSTRAAAKYFKKNNMYFDNWLNALQAYQMGAGAALKVLDEKDRGAKSMSITKRTYWYVIKYLAHKIAYEHAMQSGPEPEYTLFEYTRGSSKSLRSIASELMVNAEELEEFNKWLKRGKIPDDKSYSVIVPQKSGQPVPYVVASASDNFEPPPEEEENTLPGYDGIENPEGFPEITENRGFLGIFKKDSEFPEINGIPGIIGKRSHTIANLAERAGITEQKFRKYNEIMPHETIIVDQAYYFKKKKAKAKVHYHTVQYGESLWSISQKYGVRMSKLLKKNRLEEESDIEPGMILWMRYVRPSNEPIAYREVTQENVIASENPQDIQNISEIKAMNDSEMDTVSEPEGLPEVKSAPPEVTVEEQDMIDPIDSAVLEKPDQIKLMHTVEPRETLYAISRTYGVEVLDIVSWNDLNIADGIRIGQTLEIWVEKNWEDKISEREEIEEEDQSGDFLEYRVQPGDTLYAIANKYGVSVSDIQNWNNKSDSTVTIGEKIKIKK